MSLFYTFYGAADAIPAEFRTLIAETVGAREVSADTVIRDGMNVTVHRVAEDDPEDSTGKYFGFTEHISATFTFDNLAPPEERDGNVVRMVAAVLAVLEAWHGPGVLLHNGERAVLQRLDDGIEFDSGWDEWAEIDGVAPLMSAHVTRRLGQPLL